MVRNEILGAFGDPCQITDAELARCPQSGGERQPSRISQRTSTSCAALSGLGIESFSTKTLRQWEIQAKQVAAIIDHDLILTHVDTFPLRDHASVAGKRAGAPMASALGANASRDFQVGFAPGPETPPPEIGAHAPACARLRAENGAEGSSLKPVRGPSSVDRPSRVPATARHGAEKSAFAHRASRIEQCPPDSQAEAGASAPCSRPSVYSWSAERWTALL